MNKEYSHMLASLTSRLRARVGLFVPRERHADWLADGWAFTHGDVDVSVIVKDEDVADAKAFMTRHFYRDAPIPRALGLSDGSAQVKRFLEQEMSLYLDSGGSLQFRKKGELVGVGFMALWAKDESYEVVEADALSWHNAAAAVAAELAPAVDPRVTWRDLQFQHIYNLSQAAMKRYRRTRGLVWAGALIYSEKLRSSGLTDALLVNSAGRAADSSLMLGCQSNFPGFDKYLLKYYRNPHLEDELRYKDEHLVVDGRQVFKSLAHCQMIRFFLDLPE